MKVSFCKRDRFEFWSDLCGYLDEKEIVEGLANWVILSFFKLDDEFVATVDSDRLENYGLIGEPVNWSSVGVTHVEKKEDGSFLITIEEANSRKLEKLIEDKLAKWGWKVKCICEW